MYPGNIGGNYGNVPNPYGNRYVGPTPGSGGAYPPQQVGPSNPYGFMNFFQKIFQAMEQLFSGWNGFLNPGPRPQPFPSYGPHPGPQEPPIQALYGVAIGPNPGPQEPPIQALYGVAIGPPPHHQGPPIQALYGVAIGPGGGGFEPPIQALYGVAIGSR